MPCPLHGGREVARQPLFGVSVRRYVAFVLQDFFAVLQAPLSSRLLFIHDCYQPPLGLGNGRCLRSLRRVNF